MNNPHKVTYYKLGFNDKLDRISQAGSGGVVLGPMKYFPPVFYQADYSTHFEGPRFA